MEKKKERRGREGEEDGREKERKASPITLIFMTIISILGH